MITILFMVSVALLLSITFVACYLWSVSNGQFDDLTTPSLRMLKDEISKNNIAKKAERKSDESRK